MNNKPNPTLYMVAAFFCGGWLTFQGMMLFVWAVSTHDKATQALGLVGSIFGIASLAWGIGMHRTNRKSEEVRPVTVMLIEVTADEEEQEPATH